MINPTLPNNTLREIFDLFILTFSNSKNSTPNVARSQATEKNAGEVLITSFRPGVSTQRLLKDLGVDYIG